MQRNLGYALGLALGLVTLRAFAEGDEPPKGSATQSHPPRTMARETATPKQDERRYDIIYMEAETGLQYTSLESLSVQRDVIPSTIRRNDMGAMLGAAAGIKLLFLTVGPRVRAARFQDWDLWTLALELGWRTPLGAFEPYFRFGGGYARLGRAFDALLGNRQSVTVQGYCLRLTVGADYFISPAFSLGASLGGEVVGMYRPGINLNSPDGLANELYKLDGTSAGVAVTGTLGLGVHL